MKERDTVIMYRSEMDAMVSEYWWDVFQRHPEWFVYGLAAIIALSVACLVISSLPKKRKNWRF